MIEAYISENGTEPESGEALTVEDLIELKTDPTVYPRPPQMTSIPAMLSFFQNEWDALALQTYTLQKELEQSRKELTVALYENDAAVRVIAQLTKERDEAREALANVNIGRAAPTSTNGDAMQVDSAPLPAAILEMIDSVKERYATVPLNSICLLTSVLVCPKRDESVLFQMTGLRPKKSQAITPPQPQKRPILAAPYSVYIPLEIWFSLPGMAVRQEFFLCQKTE